MLRFGSVCSGIEAASVAWEPLGWTPAWFAEIEPFPNAVLAHRWPTVPNLGDILSDDFIARAAARGQIDVLVGGTPCQGFSLAGKQEGLRDPRSALALRFLEIARAIQPTWLVWENVPGCLSTNGGRDFGAFLGSISQLGYRWAYRVLDAQFFGTPQRRRRVFLVGRLGGRCPGPVLFEPEGEGRDSPPLEAAGTAAPAGTAGGDGPVRVYRNSGRGYWSGDGTAATIGTQGRGIHETNLAVTAYAINNDSRAAFDLVAQPLRGGARAASMVAVRERDAAGKYHYVVRRLTPLEYERLQGFQDLHTFVPFRGKPATDGPRYRALGNSIAVPVLRWIGRRLGAEHGG